MNEKSQRICPALTNLLDLSLILSFFRLPPPFNHSSTRAIEDNSTWTHRNSKPLLKGTLNYLMSWKRELWCDSIMVLTRIASLFETSNFADFTIKFKDIEYRVHRQIVACHSKYFKKCFDSDFEVCRHTAHSFKTIRLLCSGGKVRYHHAPR